MDIPVNGQSSACILAVPCGIRVMVYRLRTYLLVLFLWLTTQPAKSELEITIYAFRTASDFQHLTYDYDYIIPESYRDIQKLPNVNLVQSGPTGQMSSTFTNGTNSNHTLLTINGMPVKDHSTPTGVDDISQHSLVGVNSVEVINGPMSTLYGPNAVGGVINMTQYATEGNTVELSVGSNNTSKQKIKLGDYVGTTLVDISAEFYNTDGISVYPQGEERDGHSSENFTIKTSRHVAGEWWMNANINSKHNTTDLDGYNSDTVNYTSDWKFNNQYVDFLTGDTKFAINRVEHNRTYDLSGTQDLYHSETVDLVGNHVFRKDWGDLTIGAEQMFIQADFNTNINGYTSSVDRQQTVTGGFVNYDLRRDSVLYSVGTRVDLLSDHQNQTTHRLGISWDGWRTSISNSYKAPTLYEQYGTDNWGFQGNPDLDVEQARTVEVGYASTQHSYDVSVYTTRMENLLVYSGNSYVNDTGTATSTGINAGKQWTLAQGLAMNNSVSWNISEDSAGTQQLRRPKWSLSNSVDYTRDNTHTVLTHTYTGTHVDIDSATWARTDQPSVNRFDLDHTVYLDHGASITLSVNNITDTQWEQPNGYNQTGRTWMLTYSKNF